MVRDIGMDTARKYYKLLKPNLQNHTLGKDLYYKLFQKDDIIQLNKIIPALSLQDTSGRKIQAAEYDGKYVILNFWASWCKPCIEEMPLLLQLYTENRDKGLEVIGISMDTDRANWINAINKHKLNWINSSDLNGNNGDMVKMFGVESIPVLYFLSPERILLSIHNPQKEGSSIEKFIEFVKESLERAK